MSVGGIGKGMMMTSEQSKPVPTHTNVVEWVPYSEERKPKSAGVYEFRVPSASIPGMIVVVAAHMRVRCVGWKNVEVLSPPFDHWNGYSLQVPVGIEWRDATRDHNVKHELDVVVLSIEGHELLPCPFCGEIPTWVACQKSGGGMVVCPSPEQLNQWWLKCCNWAKSPHSHDPRKLVNERNALLTKARGETHTT